MRALYFPEFYTSRELTGCSAVSTPLKLMEALQRLDPPEFCTFGLPRTKGDFTWDDATFVKPWLDARMIGQDRWFTQPMPPIDGEWLEAVLPKKAKAPLMDYALTWRFTHAASIATAFYAPQNKWTWVPEIPVVTWVMESGDSPPIRSLHWQTLASASVGALVLMNEHDRNEWLDMLSVLVHPDEMERLQDHVYVVNPMADFAAVDAEFARHEAQREARIAAGESVVLFHGGSFEPKRNLPKLVEIVEHLRFVGLPIRGQLFGPKLGGAERSLPPSDNVTVELGVDHAGYVDRLGEADLVWAAIEWESTALSAMEAIRSGALPIWLDREWVKPRMPDGYPLIAHSYEELETVTRLAVENYAALRKEWGPRCRAHLEPYGPDQIAGRWRDTMERVMAGPRARNLVAARKVNPVFSLLEAACEAEGWTEVTDVRAVHAAISKQSRKGADFKYANPTMLRWMFMALGWKDRCDRPGLSLVKP